MLNVPAVIVKFAVISIFEVNVTVPADLFITRFPKDCFPAVLALYIF